MKTFDFLLKKSSIVLIAMLLISTSAIGATFTAVTSGSFNSSATWGGTTPPSTITADQIIIPTTIIVDLDNDLTLDGAVSSLDVDGELNTSTNAAIIVNSGTVSGTGEIIVDSISAGVGSIILFTGSITTEAMSNAAASLQLASDIDVNQSLTLMSGSSISLISGGDLMLGNNATVVIESGGGLSVSGGALGFSGDYNVMYTGGSSTAGLELSGSGLNDIMINVGSGNSVDLSSDLTVNGTLSLDNGTLNIGSNNLTFSSSGDLSASGSGSISTGSNANIMINASSGLSGALDFDASGNTVNNFTVSVGSGNNVQVSNGLNVDGTLQLDNGTTLDISGASLTINGDLSGSGMLHADALSNLSIDVSGGISDSLNFTANGQTVNDLSVNVGSGNSVNLSSASMLEVMGNLNLSGGSNLNISGSDLTLIGDLNGNGSLMVDGNSGVSIDATGGLSSNLSFNGGSSASIGSIDVNVGSGNSVSLDSDLSVMSDLSIQSGMLDLNGADLTLTGDINIASSGGASISSDANSSISIDVANAPSSAISFSANGNTVSDFDLNIASGGSLMLNSDLNVDGDLNFSGSGSLDIMNSDLNIGSNGSISGSGSSSYIITSGSGQVGMQLTAGGSNSVEFPVGTSANFSPAMIQLNGLQSGMVMVNFDSTVSANGTSGADMSLYQSMVAATWNVSSDISNNLDLDLQVMWSSDMEVNGFDNAEIYLSHYVNGSWDSTAAVSANAEGNGMFSIEREGITSLSPFAVFDKSTAVSVGEFNQDFGLSVFPNPTAGKVIIKTDYAGGKSLNAQIIDVSGKVLKTYELNDTRKNISLDHLSQGSYFIRLYNDDVSIVEQIQVQ